MITSVRTQHRVPDRRYRRFRLSAPVVFRWRDRDGNVQQGTGYSRDISARGIYICTPSKSPADNAILRYEVLLPTASDDDRALLFRAAGTVRRSDQVAGRAKMGGFAVETRRSGILRAAN